MTNYTNLVLQAILSILLGLIFSFLIALLAVNRIGIFWFLLIFIWFVIAGINGYISKSKLDPIVFVLFAIIFWSISIFFFSLLISSFSKALLESFRLNEGGVNQWSTIQQALLITLLTSLVLFTVLTIGTYVLFFIKKYIQKIKPISLDKIEEKAFEKFEAQTDSGIYIKRPDDFD